MSAAEDRPVLALGRPLSTMLPDLGVNVGRKQREHAPPVPTEGSLLGYAERRVVIDVQANGEFTVYSDPDVRVICRCAHVADDELFQMSSLPIREDWLEMPVGHGGDGSVADLLAEVVADWPNGDPT